MHKPKVLIVDDEVTNLKLLKEILQDEYMLALVKDGTEALRRAVDLPDLILLDIMMPKMDGFSMLRSLSHNPDFQSIQIITTNKIHLLHGLFSDFLKLLSQLLFSFI